jgi:hypothetical protein
MPIQTYYRNGRFIKSYLIRYLTGIFLAAEKEQIILTDGTKKIEFSATPKVESILSWNERNLPAVLIGPARITMKSLSTTKELKFDARAGDDEQFTWWGGDVEVSLDLLARARTIVERDNIVDIVLLYLSIPSAKDFFRQQAIVMNALPTASGESAPRIPNIDFPIYQTSIGITLTGVWEYREAISHYRLNNVIADITAVMNFDDE